MSTWTRIQTTQSLAAHGNFTLATLAIGHTLLRVHAGAVVRLRVPAEEDPNVAAQFITGFGVYTANAAGGTTLYPIANPSDFGPPTQRWLHWRMLYLNPTGSGTPEYGGYWVWTSAPGPDPIEIEAPVKANAVALNLLAAWDTAAAPKAGWATSLSFWASILTS